MKLSRLTQLLIGIDHQQKCDASKLSAVEFYGYMARQLLQYCTITEKPNLTQFMEESA